MVCTDTGSRVPVKMRVIRGMELTGWGTTAVGKDGVDVKSTNSLRSMLLLLKSYCKVVSIIIQLALLRQPKGQVKDR